MRIVVDVSDISPRRGKSRGIYSYARHLAEALVPALPDGTSLCVLCNGDSLPDFEPLRSHRAVSVRAVYRGFPGVLQRVLWCAVAGALALRRERADVYFSPKGFAPLGLRLLGRVGRVAVTVHDLIPLWYARHHPATVGRLERLFVNSWLVHSARTADRVVAISQATADALRIELGRSQGVQVVHNGVPLLPAATRSGPRDCLFAMTSPLAHKNLAGVLAAYRNYRTLTASPLPLVVCGVTGDHGEGVTAVVDVTPSALADLYTRARAFIFLPLIEGFGFPVLEALRYGTLVVCSDIPSLRESSGGAATFVEPADAAACARALVRVVESAEADAPSRRHVVSSAGDWDRCARATLAAITEGSPVRGEPMTQARSDQHDPASPTGSVSSNAKA